MSSGPACRFPRGHRDRWRVTVHKANYSAFNGCHRTPSAYSEVTCLDCGRSWRTKAGYVDRLAIVSTTEWEGLRR